MYISYGIKFIFAEWCQVASEILVNTGSGNGLLPDGNKQLPETVLTSH